MTVATAAPHHNLSLSHSDKENADLASYTLPLPKRV